ncbi:Protein CBR-EARS-1 [Caenorhabditis briggsae]|uniref:glutamate--tRNA ligase n=2 Tax=Caenorhabditis briggsae TaxID=6238 RepID=A8XZV8_CAEBR|nr:Protein CBR-EARS-1 [Caenorhabditis briggsae]ULU12053.1 hypothetical protein L3Y34_015419 [Caenorhabditis briggsae]CAP38175.1 Protein CBR-EARS-1 [Caenorhabditis briggsae]
MVISRELVLKADRKQAPYASLLALAASGFSLEKSVQFSDGQKLVLNLDGELVSNDVEIAKIISQSTASADRLLGTSIVDFAVVDDITNVVAEAVTKNDFSCLLEKDFPNKIFENLLTVADFAIFSVAHNNAELKTKFSGIIDRVLKDSSLAAAHNFVGLYKVAAVPAVKNVLTAGKEKKKDEGKFVELPGAEKGKVVVRFPPEASGYLHIGHAKAALLNQYYQQEFEGQLIMRFDDTNPAKENAHFEHVIKEDLAMLNIIPDRWTHSSDHFEMLLTMCEKLLKEGKAFVDDTDTETMRNEREQRQDSRNRGNTPDKNLQLWEEMKKGTEKGLTCCVRIKIDMKSNNGAMRDPTIYRCKPEEHVRTGLKYKVYPTYDFTCPIVDSVEGVTHALRTTEYHDRDDQYYFICDALGLRRPYIWEYARLNMTNTVMSKRKLTWFVDEGHVEGWDDPRLPTVRGVMRRGLTVDGLKQFIVAQGGSRSVVMMEWDKIWAFNKKVIDPVAPRYTALETTDSIVTIELVDSIGDDTSTVSLHPKNAEVGNKDIHKGKKLFLEQIDASTLKEGETVTFVNWGNIKIGKIEKKGNVVTKITASLQLDNTDYKKTTKVTWLGDVKTESGKPIPVVTAEYDHIISKAIIGKDEDWKQFINFNSVHYKKMIGEPAIKNVKKGDIIQLQRKGFYIVDQPYSQKSELSGVETPLLLISIPDGHTGKEAEKVPKAAAATNEQAKSSGSSEALQIYTSIEQQGNLVRDLKAKDAKSQDTKDAIAKLLELKKKFKDVTSADFKPGQPPAAPAQSSTGGSDIAAQIDDQGLLVRDLKAKDAKSQATKDAIAKLLELKKKYKDVTGSEYKPGAAPAAPAQPSTGGSDIAAQIDAQGLLVRDLKAKDAKSQATKDAIAKLLELKKQYKDVTGSDYKPGSAPAAAPAQPSTGGSDIAAQIDAQGLLVRDLKAKDAKSQATKDAIAKLLELKKQYKDVTGSDYKPGSAPAAAPAQPSTGGSDITAQIDAQGLLVRDLKAKDAKSQETKDAIAKLLELKKKYKDVTGSDYKPGAAPAAPAAAPSSTGANGVDEAALLEEINQQGAAVREAKAKDPKSQESTDAINKLLALKATFKKVTGKDVPAPSNSKHGKKK